MSGCGGMRGLDGTRRRFPVKRLSSTGKNKRSRLRTSSRLMGPNETLPQESLEHLCMRDKCWELYSVVREDFTLISIPTEYSLNYLWRESTAVESI